MKIIIAFKKKLKPETEWYWKTSSKLIKWWNKAEYFHVEIAIDDKWISANTSKGIEIYHLDPLHNPYYDYYEMEVEDLTPSQSKLFWDFIENQKGSGYDWKGIYLTQILKLDWESKEKWFCSEIASKILQLLYVKEFISVKPNRLSPNDVFKLVQDKCKQIYINGTKY